MIAMTLIEFADKNAEGLAFLVTLALVGTFVCVCSFAEAWKQRGRRR